MIEIIEYKPFKHSGSKATYLKGFAKIRFASPWGKMTCTDLQVYSKNGKHWVNFPARKVEEAGGVKYFQYTRFEVMEESQKFSEDVIKALISFCATSAYQDSLKPKIDQPSAKEAPSLPISMDQSFVVTDNQVPF